MSENNTVSNEVALALSAALSKIETYVPTNYVDNSEPDIDAENLNRAEQAIMRVTNLANAAVDVIQNLQSQLDTANSAISVLNAETEIPLIKNDSLTVFDVKCTKVGRTVYVVAAINSSTNIPAGNGIVSGFPKLKNNNVASFAAVDDSGYTYPFYIYNTQLVSRITTPGNKTIRFTVSYITEN